MYHLIMPAMHKQVFFLLSFLLLVNSEIRSVGQFNSQKHIFFLKIKII